MYDIRAASICDTTSPLWIPRWTFSSLLPTSRGGLIEHNRAAHRQGHQTPVDIEQIVLELRQAHLRWAPGSSVCQPSTRMFPARVLET